MGRPAMNGFWTRRPDPKPTNDSMGRQWQMQRHRKGRAELFLVGHREQQTTLLFAAVPRFHRSITL